VDAKDSRGELENSSRQPVDLTKLGQKEVHLTSTKKEYSLFLGVGEFLMMMMGEYHNGHRSVWQKVSTEEHFI
jgi:hypothetical protein